MKLTKEFVNSCRRIGVLRDFLLQAMDQVDNLEKENKELKDAQRWRKFPDEKPDDSQTVWAYEANTKRILILEYSKNDESEGFICFPYNSDFYEHITKWMPFEKPKSPE